MAYHPFTSEQTTTLNEVTYKTVPNTFGFQDVNATEIHRRSVVDSYSQSITSNQQPHVLQPQLPQCYQNSYSYPTPQLYAVEPQKQLNPNFGLHPTITVQNNPCPNVSAASTQLSFQIGPQQLFPPNQMPEPMYAVTINPKQIFQRNLNLNLGAKTQQQQKLTLQQQIALKQLEKQGLEMTLLQQKLKKNAYNVKFHYNGQTSTTDLLEGPSQIPFSRGMPDFTNLSGIKEKLKHERRGMDRLPCDCPPTCLYSPMAKSKKLILKEKSDGKHQRITENPACDSDNQPSSSKIKPAPQEDEGTSGPTPTRKLNKEHIKSRRGSKSHSRSKNPYYDDEDDDYSD